MDACLERGWKVVVYDNFSKGRREYLPHRPGLSVIEGDILDKDQLSRAVEASGPDVVFHLAAIHYIPECEQNPGRAIQVNIEGTQRVLDACVGRPARLFFTSTGAIYDPAVTTPLNEESPVRTADVYGITKHTGEQLVRYWVRQGRGRACIARLFNAVGPRETNAHLIPAIMEQLAQGVRRIELGNLYPKRDYIHARDIADGLVALASTPAVEDVELFNIGSGTEHTVSDLVEMCAGILGEPIAVESVASRRRDFDRPNQLADIGRIRARTGWAPARDVRLALDELWCELKAGS